MNHGWRTCRATYLALATVLVLYPSFRIAIAYLDLFPLGNTSERWWGLWFGVVIGHWVCAAVVLWAIRAERSDLASVGLDLGAFARRRLVLLALLSGAIVVGLLVPDYFYGDVMPEQMRSHPFGPVTSAQRIFWIAVALTAGFVEELLYRGYAITRLRRLAGLPAAIVLSVASFALMHGPSAFIPRFLLLYLVSGGVFAVVFVLLRFRRLEALIAAHTAVDLLLVAAP